jgi:DNA-binding transcriptional ArsR family regulator
MDQPRVRLVRRRPKCSRAILAEMDGSYVSESALTQVATAVGDPTRVAILTALLGGQWLAAGELARHAGVAASTASEHLARLLEARLIACRRTGRHRYYALAGVEVAAALEALARLTPAPCAVLPGPADAALRFARTCYDHLAGELGVQITELLVAEGIVTAGLSEVTPGGEEWLAAQGIDVAALGRSRRSMVRPCLDWSVRRDHMAGAVGSAMLEMMLARGWVARLPKTRAVRLTLRGREGWYRALRIELPLAG